MTVSSHQHGLVLVREHALLPPWVVALIYLVLLAGLVAGVWFMFLATRKMSRPGRIVEAVVAVLTAIAAVAAFLDGYRPTGDWRGGMFEAAFMVVYGLVAAAVVLAADAGVRRLRAATPV